MSPVHRQFQSSSWTVIVVPHSGHPCKAGGYERHLSRRRVAGSVSITASNSTLCSASGGVSVSALNRPCAYISGRDDKTAASLQGQPQPFECVDRVPVRGEDSVFSGLPHEDRSVQCECPCTRYDKDGWMGLLIESDPSAQRQIGWDWTLVPRLSQGSSRDEAAPLQCTIIPGQANVDFRRVPLIFPGNGPRLCYFQPHTRLASFETGRPPQQDLGPLSMAATCRIHDRFLPPLGSSQRALPPVSCGMLRWRQLSRA